MKIRSVKFVKGYVRAGDIPDDGKTHIVFLGRSNVGKSSFINSLLDNKKVSKSSSTPGKTREVNLFDINDNFYFVDLPGYGYARMSRVDREKLYKLISSYLERDFEKSKRFFLVVLDAQVGLTDMDQGLISGLIDNNEDFLLVLNKSDRLNQSDRSKALKNIRNFRDELVDQVALYSARTHKWRHKLWESLENVLHNRELPDDH